MVKDANFLVCSNGDHTATHVGEDVFDKHLLRLELFVQIDILDANGDLTGKVEENLELIVGIGKAGDAFAKIQDADQGSGGDPRDTRHPSQRLHLAMDFEIVWRVEMTFNLRPMENACLGRQPPGQAL